jgi:hypothetical protein
MEHADALHALFERHLKNYTDTLPAVGEIPSATHVCAIRAMIRMVADASFGNNYVPKNPEQFSEAFPALAEQFMRIREGSASPTHALEALIGGNAIGRSNASPSANYSTR